jgi:hypothetical protein
MFVRLDLNILKISGLNFHKAIREGMSGQGATGSDVTDVIVDVNRE